jgi:hypothetical protein
VTGERRYAEWMKILFALLLLPALAQANPYPIEALVPKDPPQVAAPAPKFPLLDARALRARAAEVLRVRLDWDAASDSFKLMATVRERSGTAGVVARSASPDRLGSYQAVLKDRASGAVLAHDSIGTGAELRKLTRSLTFRFPMPAAPAILELTAENPTTGAMEKVLSQVIDPATAATAVPPAAEVRLVRAASEQPALKVVLYADGFKQGSQEKFWKAAEKAVKALETARFPGLSRMEFAGVFMPSATALGSAREGSLPVPERDSALGLYFPYWEKFGRWYHVVYPTREERFRSALAAIPYDYPVALLDDGEYWGVGNYRTHTAVPVSNGSFTYLLLHEFGHFFGLNEEYEGGGRTELEFAPGIEEPWSQNITFLKDASHASLKWKAFVKPATPLPTPDGVWTTSRAYGAYSGGYADSPPLNRSHKPGQSCVMEAGPEFCPVCRAAIEAVVLHDLGLDLEAFASAFSSAP